MNSDKNFSQSLFNKEGFLINYKLWNYEIGLEIAKKENILLNSDHWKVINIVRKYYKKEKSSPAIRKLINLIKKKYGSKIGNSLYLQLLFPKSPAVQAAKIAGIPKPKSCI